MNKVILIGRLCGNPDVRQTQSGTYTAKYKLAVDRRFKKENEDGADFIQCVVFGKGAEFAEKYLNKGMKIAVTGRIQTGSYTNKDGQKVYTTDVIVDEQEFVEPKNTGEKTYTEPIETPDDFVSIPDDMSEDGLPFN